MRCLGILALTIVLAFTGLVFLPTSAFSPHEASALAGEVANVTDFMLVVHGPNGLLGQIKEALDGKGPADDKAWRGAKARASVVSYLCDTILAKAKPPKGDAASWKSKVGEYAGTAKSLAKALEAKDASAAKRERDRRGKSCESCHKAHK
jgi:hypothetical protein